MNYFCRTILVFLIFSSCSDELSLSFSSEVFTEEDLDQCQTEFCSAVTLNYLKASGDPVISEKINTAIETHIIEGLFLGDDDHPSAKDIRQAATQFIMAYRDHHPDLPSELDFGGYEAEITIENTHQTETLLCLQSYKFLFTGGAHGYGGTTFLLFNTKTGTLLNNESLFSDRNEFERFAETKFREAFEIPQSESINATGFWFDEDQFHLPESIGIRENNLVLIYNPYEIASYAEGLVSLEIPLSEIELYLNSNLL